MGLIGGGRKTVPLVALSSELVSPTSDTNKNSSVLAVNLAVVAATSTLTKLHDEKKAMAPCLFSLYGKFGWDQISDEDCAAGLQKMAVNDPAEHLSGGLTSQLQAY
eukprot:8509216-Ditylum_brightwellii.AAC.1